MKKLLIVFSFFAFLTSSAQENKYDQLTKEASEAADSVFADEIAQIKNNTAELVARISPNSEPGSHIMTNHKALPALLTEFRDGARYYKADFVPELLTLNKVILVRADLNFLGGVMDFDGSKEIWINSILPVQYPNLFWAVFYHQMGTLYGLPVEKNQSKLEIMSDRWEMNPQYELWAYNRRQSHTIKKTFFEQLAKKFPLDKKI